LRFCSSRREFHAALPTAADVVLEILEVGEDDLRREHEETVWMPLDQTVSDTLRAVDQLAILLTQVRHECEFPGY
jgi:hypothetical protein